MMPQEFLDQLRSEVEEIEADYGLTDESSKFAIWVGWKLFELNPQRIIDEHLLYTEPGKGAVIGFFEKSTEDVIVVTCKYKSDKKTNSIDQKEFQDLVGLWFSIKDRKLHSTNMADNFLLELEDKEAISGIVSFTSYVVTNGTLSPPSQEIAKEQAIQLVDIDGLKTTYIRMQHPLRVKEPDVLEFTLPNPQVLTTPSTEGIDKEIVTLVCQLQLTMIHEWVSRFRNGLFSANLRLRLREYDKNARELEKKVQDTILSNPERMFILNNGITITCERIESPSGNQEPKVIKLHKPQIVNGCQTSWTIHDTISKILSDDNSPPPGFVLAKIVQTRDKDLAQEITSSSNRQNAIQKRDQRVKDERQHSISERLAQYTPNLGVYWDYQRGGWDNIETRGQESRYLIKGRKSYRKLENGLAGQIILAMAGYLAEAKNQGGKLFDILYEIAFAYNLPPEKRFIKPQQEPLLSSGGSNALSTHIEDLLFGFAIYQHALTVFQHLYAERTIELKAQLISTTSSAEKETMEKAMYSAASRDFVKFWAFDIVRLIHLVVEEWIKKYPDVKRDDLRRRLVGDLTNPKFLDPLFLPKTQRADWFIMERNWSMPNTLDARTPSEMLPELGKWFKSLEEMGATIITEIKAKEPDISSFSLINRPSTRAKIIGELSKYFNSANFTQIFPIESK